MKITHISIFLPNDTNLYRTLFSCLEKSFVKAGIKVSGCLRLLAESEMYLWIQQNKPDAVFEMNRVKDEIPILHDLGIPHITWVVDFQGRTQNHLKGSDITYFFDPNADANFDAGGIQDWLPPGTCTKTFSPLQLNLGNYTEFNFIGHIPKPWSDEELNRKIDLESESTFEMLLNGYEEHLANTKFEMKTLEDLENIIKNICKKISINESYVERNVYYDLMEKTKRLNNRAELLGIALKRSDSIAIYGSLNWKEWPAYRKYYKYFINCPSEMNIAHQSSAINLHDGVSFHFRAIDCMASGGVIFWYDNTVVYKEQKRVRGLYDFFDDQCHFYTFREDNFDEAYENFKRNSGSVNKIKNDIISIINSHHTWDHRVNKIINDIKLI
ncbi:glycosyltransferase [Methylobacter tundripaludum]|uniref:Spore protein YkvP/CgeB glycosyl transferase-like domain-containing protein n=1 Tax=Methylobacter tundripaludum (strain ATCC BAA-1195 / DSM 17260 / SV96) TaxID=697282 RepID=G3IT04_METTV|nr:glycosyltransferase [Methylobacter tundripaludum]EGW22478.1 hypothetical protein Mettu_1292 [Methylobacter tundripaludum SV96]